MKRNTPIILLSFILGACHHPKKNIPAPTPISGYVSMITANRTWSGYHSVHRYGYPTDPANFSQTFTDTVFSLQKSGDSLVGIPISSQNNLLLKFRTMGSSPNSLKFDSIGMFVLNDSLMYYPDADSVVYYYCFIGNGIHGMEDPLMEYIFLYSHK